MGTPMGLPPADGCSSSRALKLCICVHHCIPWVWGLLIWTFQKKIDSLPAVLYINSHLSVDIQILHYNMDITAGKESIFFGNVHISSPQTRGMQ